MKMFLTRFGENSRMVICGDPRQVDLPVPGASGLADAVSKLEGVDGIATIRFGASAVVRHPIVGRIVEAYEGKDHCRCSAECSRMDERYELGSDRRGRRYRRQRA